MSSRRQNQAVSMLEIVVAMNCTALLMALLCQALPMARRQTRQADITLGGAMLASNVLETYMTVPIEDWPTQPVALAGERRTVELRTEPWGEDKRILLATAIVMVGNQQLYRLETLVYP